MSACSGNSACSFSSSAVRFEPLYHHHSKNVLLDQRASGAGILHPDATWVTCQMRSTTDRGRGQVSAWSATMSFSSYPSSASQGRTRIGIWSCASTPMAKCLRLRVVARTIQAEGNLCRPSGCQGEATTLCKSATQARHRRPERRVLLRSFPCCNR
jgi:hypothetical protein